MNRTLTVEDIAALIHTAARGEALRVMGSVAVKIWAIVSVIAWGALIALYRFQWWQLAVPLALAGCAAAGVWYFVGMIVKQVGVDAAISDKIGAVRLTFTDDRLILDAQGEHVEYPWDQITRETRSGMWLLCLADGGAIPLPPDQLDAELKQFLAGKVTSEKKR